MEEDAGATEIRVDEPRIRESGNMMRGTRALTAALGLLTICGGTATAQQIGSESSTVLTAYVTEQATLSLPTRVSTRGLIPGEGAVAASVGLTSTLLERDARSLRVTWSWASGRDPGASTRTLVQDTVLPLRGSVELGTALQLPRQARGDTSAHVRVRVESFEF